ncbi:MAG: hypothetical protein K2X51_05325 [Burkholderiales bacterium]|nr:hypothetical protein [Burkholderiales bacterium]
MQAQTIERRFKANRVFINDKVRMGNYTRFDLWCGLIVNVYDTGSVVVQGRIRAFPYPYDPLPPIRKILPIDTAWQFSRAKK